MRSPYVTILMPVWNVEATLARAWASLQQQTFPEWELVVVDDGSTDASPRGLAEMAAADGRVRVVRTDHRGIVAALNTGLSLARGVYVARMDADDEARPERLARQLEWLDREPTLGVVGSLVEYGGDRSRAGGYARHVDWLNSILAPEEVALNRFVEAPLAHPSVMFRACLVGRHGGYREGTFPEDYELWLRWLDAGVRMGKVPEPLLRWNDPPTRLSRVDPRYGADAFYACKAFYLARWLKRRVAPGRPVLVWGAGRVTRKRVAPLVAEGQDVAGFIDVDPNKVGRKRDGRQVLAVSDLPPPDRAFVLGYVGKRGARELIRGWLRERGYREGLDFLMAA